MVIIFLSVLLLLSTRIITVYYLNKKSGIYTDGDAIGHLNYIKEIYTHNGKIQKKLEKYLLDYNDYPNGFHKLFYILKIPIKTLERFGGYIPTLLDFGLLGFIALLIHIFGGDNYLWLLSFPLLRLLIANEGRSSHFSERAYGVLWGNLFLGSMISYYLSSDMLWAASALFSFVVFSISSKFTWQATFFITTLLSIFEQTSFFIIFYFIAFTISVIISRGYSYKVLIGLIRHSIFYKEHLSSKCFGLANHYKNFFKIFGRSNLRQKLMIFLTNSIFKLISDNPLNIAIIFLIFTQGEWSIFHSWSLAGMALVLLISLEPLKFLGEPERYLEFSIIPVFVMLSNNNIPTIITIITMLALISLYLLHWFLFIRSYKKPMRSNADMQNLLSFFIKKTNKTILTIPLRLSFFLGYFTEQHKFVTLFSNIGKNEERKNYKDLIPDYYPFPGKNLNQYISKYKIDYIIHDKKRVEMLHAHMNEQYYSFNNYTIAHENESYIVYEVSSTK